MSVAAKIKPPYSQILTCYPADFSHERNSNERNDMFFRVHAVG